MIARLRKALVLVQLLLVTFAAAAESLQGEESQAALCSIRVRQFVKALDTLLNENLNDVLILKGEIVKYFPTKDCDVSDVISISKSSKFFSELFEQYTEYTIAFSNQNFVVSFGLRKDTENIVVPNARVKFPPRP